MKYVRAIYEALGLIFGNIRCWRESGSFQQGVYSGLFQAVSLAAHYLRRLEGEYSEELPIGADPEAPENRVDFEDWLRNKLRSLNNTIGSSGLEMQWWSNEEHFLPFSKNGSRYAQVPDLSSDNLKCSFSRFIVPLSRATEVEMPSWMQEMCPGDTTTIPLPYSRDDVIELIACRLALGYMPVGEDSERVQDMNRLEAKHAMLGKAHAGDCADTFDPKHMDIAIEGRPKTGLRDNVQVSSDELAGLSFGKKDLSFLDRTDNIYVGDRPQVVRLSWGVVGRMYQPTVHQYLSLKLPETGKLGHLLVHKQIRDRLTIKQARVAHLHIAFEEARLLMLADNSKANRDAYRVAVAPYRDSIAALNAGIKSYNNNALPTDRTVSPLYSTEWEAMVNEVTRQIKEAISIGGGVLKPPHTTTYTEWLGAGLVGYGRMIAWICPVFINPRDDRKPNDAYGVQDSVDIILQFSLPHQRNDGEAEMGIGTMLNWETIQQDMPIKTPGESYALRVRVHGAWAKKWVKSNWMLFATSHTWEESMRLYRVTCPKTNDTGVACGGTGVYRPAKKYFTCPICGSRRLRKRDGGYFWS